MIRKPRSAVTREQDPTPLVRHSAYEPTRVHSTSTIFVFEVVQVLHVTIRDNERVPPVGLTKVEKGGHRFVLDDNSRWKLCVDDPTEETGHHHLRIFARRSVPGIGDRPRLALRLDHGGR